MSNLASDCRGAQVHNRSPTKALHSSLDLPFASAAGTGQGADGRARAFLSISRPHRELTNGASILGAGDSLDPGQDAFAPSGSWVIVPSALVRARLGRVAALRHGALYPRVGSPRYPRAGLCESSKEP